MKDLAARVVKGIYPPLPKTYSQDFGRIIKKMLIVTPSKRATATELLESKEMTKQFTQTLANMGAIGADPTMGAGLLGTIQLPRNLRQLSKCLPTAKYNKKPVLKRTNSEPARLPSIQLQRDNLRNAVNKNLAPIQEERKVPGIPPQSRRGNSRNRRHRLDPSNKENRSALIQAGKHALPSARVQGSRPIDVYNRNKQYVGQPLQPSRYGRHN